MTMTSHADRNLSCEEVVRAIWDYIDDEIVPDRARLIREHLDTCDGCRGLFNFEGAFLRAVSRLADDGALDTPDLRSRVVAALKAQGYHETDRGPTEQ